MHIYALFTVLPAAVQARFSILISAAFQSCKVNLLLVCAGSCFSEGILITSVQAMVDPILCFWCFNALAGDPICPTAAVLLLFAASLGGRTAGESSWTGLILSFILLAPVQLSLTAGVAGADCWSVNPKHGVHLPFFDAGAGVGTGSHMGSAIEKVSVFVIGMLIAETIVATLIKWEGDAIGANDWRPLRTC